MRRLIPLIAALALSACGGASESSSGGGQSVGLPSVKVVELNAGQGRTDLATLRPQGKPLLVWFWAPY